MYVKLLKEKQMKKGLKIAAIIVGVIIILMPVSYTHLEEEKMNG